ncbi:MAG: RagB/SusD family nutrient uptake outer membrane protein [Chitinophagaceae bacterium]|nr:RagB/SusD family nutrient uptake outer membrane protein [Chitinophagaceae bacterium]
MKIGYKNSGKAILIIGLLPLSFMLSCNKSYLEVPPQAQQPVQQFWQNQNDATEAVNAMYANTRGWTFVAFAPMAIESLGSDDATTGSDPTDGSVAFMSQFDNFTVTSTNRELPDFWNGMYIEINYCNQVIDNIPNINMDANLKARYIAEAKFLRAYSYFRLVRAFGDVPLRLHLPANSSEYNLPRTPKDQVWAAIEQDLNDAESVLPPSYSGPDVGRITKGAAQALHAKVALYQKKWADVVTFSNKVIQSGLYNLFPDFEKQYRIQNENNSESVYEIQCTYLPNNVPASNSQYCQIQQPRGGFDGNGWGYNNPTQDLVDAFEPNDPRLNATILFRGSTSAEGDLIPLTAANPMYNYKSYVPFPVYVNDNGGSDQNVRVIRYSDVLLMNAEANNELGNTSDALASLEKVRKRARDFAIAHGAPANTLPPVTTTDQTALRAAIYHERRVELAMDFNSRYFDVIRQGRGTAVFGPMGWKAGKNEVWPIPQSEIDNSFGVLTQNPGY